MSQNWLCKSHQITWKAINSNVSRLKIIMVHKKEGKVKILFPPTWRFSNENNVQSLFCYILPARHFYIIFIIIICYYFVYFYIILHLIPNYICIPWNFKQFPLWVILSISLLCSNMWPGGVFTPCTANPWRKSFSAFPSILNPDPANDVCSSVKFQFS